MKILHATSELFPYSKTGGLADMVDGLVKALAGHGHQIGVVTPLYRGIRERFDRWGRIERKIRLALAGDSLEATVHTLQPLPNLKVYFIDQPALFDRTGLYMEKGRDYPDNAARFIFFSKCVAHLARHLPRRPDLVHVHDWQVGLVPLLIRHQRDHDGWFAAPRTVLTIHNLAFQGLFPAHNYGLTNLPPWYFHSEGLEFHEQMNCLKAGIVFADSLITVSPRYAREITTAELGFGLDGVLRKRREVLTGVLNGVDYEEWKTRNNPHLHYSYDAHDLRGKMFQKRALQKELGLPQAPDGPLFGVVSRLSQEKGMDIEVEALQQTLQAPMQFVLLGSGAEMWEKAFTDLAARFPGKVALQFGYNQGLAHRIEAGADFFLMPSQFEPCGLNQMYSLRYGTVPVVRATGGLDDSVVDIREDPTAANGIKFHDYSAAALAKAVQKALVLYQHRPLLKCYRQNGMSADFSWERTCLQYLKIYEKTLGLKPSEAV